MNHPPAGHTRILAWMGVFIAVNQLGFGSVMPVLALYARSFDVGQIADRAGRRGALALGGLVTAASNLLCACAPTYPHSSPRASSPAPGPGPGCGRCAWGTSPWVRLTMSGAGAQSGGVVEGDEGVDRQRLCSCRVRRLRVV
jgi:MFS family permease